MKLGKLLSVGEVAEQPPVEEPAVAPPELARADTADATGNDDRARVPAVGHASR